MTQSSQSSDINTILKNLGIQDENNGSSTGSEFFANGEMIESYSPTNGKLIAKIKSSSLEDYDQVLEKANAAFLEFRKIPAQKRGELVRQLGNQFREKHITLEL